MIRLMFINSTVNLLSMTDLNLLYVPRNILNQVSNSIPGYSRYDNSPAFYIGRMLYREYKND